MKSMPMNIFETKRSTLEGVLLDVRETSEFKEGSIPGAVFLPLSTFPGSLKTLDKNKSYYLLCQSGGRSSLGCIYMRAKGFKSVNLKGGIEAYRGTLQ